MVRTLRGTSRVWPDYHQLDLPETNDTKMHKMALSQMANLIWITSVTRPLMFVLVLGPHFPLFNYGSHVVFHVALNFPRFFGFRESKKSAYVMFGGILSVTWSKSCRTVVPSWYGHSVQLFSKNDNGIFAPFITGAISGFFWGTKRAQSIY